MKFLKACLAFGMLAGYLLTTPVNAQSLEGLWRGEMELQPGVSLVIGIRIEEGALLIESPNQGMYDREPTTFDVSASQVSFTDEGLSASFQGTLQDGMIKGTFRQGRNYELNLTKLDETALARMNEFEGQYAGDLILNGRTSLPLVLNVVALNAGYLVTLDSPEQQSFGIPVNEFEITNEKLSFASAMIQASYEGTFNGELYEGRFLQGQARVLNLKKLQRGEPHTAQTNKLEVGVYGGGIATIENGEVEYEYFSDHNAQTQYEIGSVTKTMVSFLLAKALSEGIVTDATRIREVWPETASNPTLIDLATHFSGLPRLPLDLLSTADMNDPYQHYSDEMLAAALETTESGERAYEYSNFGYGVLAEALERKAEKSFSELLQAWLFTPASMNETYVAMSTTTVSEQLSQGHSLTDPTQAWTFDALAGAGAVVSTLPDMVNYVRFVQNAVRVNEPFAQSLFTPRESLGAKSEQALGWIISTDPNGKKYAWHNGQTAGFSSFVGFYLDGSRAVVLLNNQAINVNDEALARLFE